MPEEAAVTTEQAPPPQQPDLATLQREIETLKGQVAEHQEASRYWYEQAEAGKAAAKPAEKPAAPDDVDLLDIITTQGSKGLNAYLKQQGYASKDEVDALVNSKAREMLTEQELIKQYPDLASDKRDSEFFKATAQEYGRLMKDGMPGHLAMQQAAANTELHFLRTGKLKTSFHQETEKQQDKEKQRLARINAQSGDRGTRVMEPEEDDEEITPEEQKIIRGMLVGQPGTDGKPMNFEQAVEVFKKRAKSGTIQTTPRSVRRR